MTAQIFDWQRQIMFSPEDDILFNSTRILILFDVLREEGIENGIDLERLTYYDFFAANPFIIFEKNDPLWTKLEIIGFETQTINYISSSQIYRTKRSNIKHYLALLLSKNLINILNIDGKIQYRISNFGYEIVSKIKSIYAMQYRKSLKIIIKKLKSLSDTKLWNEASQWLDAKSFQVDLFEFEGDDNGIY